MARRKGTELNNVSETWQQNEQALEKGYAPAPDNASVNDDLNRLVKKEAAEYDRADKEERLLDGERASVNDGKTEGSADV